MRLGLVLTNDWELFGDGSGDYFEIQHRPLYELLDTVEAHGAKLTLMAELGQQWGHLGLAPDNPRSAEIATAWESAVKDTVRRGSDVQLHIHTQWLDARFIDGEWRLNLDKISIAKLNETTIASAIRRGKDYLDSLLRPVDPDYECMAFRAGAYALQPSKRVVELLLEAGMRCDTSVTKGLLNHKLYDFRKACYGCRPYFVRSDDITQEAQAKEGLLELPIYSYQTPDTAVIRKAIGDWQFYRLTLGARTDREDEKWFAEKRRITLKRFPANRRLKALDDNPLHDLRGSKVNALKWGFSKIAGKRTIHLDYDGLPPDMFVRCLEKAFVSRDLADLRDTKVTVPIVALGHIKSMHSPENLEKILSLAKQRLGDRITFWTLREAVDYWMDFVEAGESSSLRRS